MDREIRPARRVSRMKTFLVGYWFIGCLIAGLAIGVHRERCPRDPVGMTDARIAVVIWPVFPVAVLSSSRSVELSACEVAL